MHSRITRQLTYGQVAGGHVVSVRVLRHPGEVLTQEAEGVVVVARQLTHQLPQLPHGRHVRPGRRAAVVLAVAEIPDPGAGPGTRRRTRAADADEIIVQFEGHQRLWQLAHVELHNIGDDIWMDVSEVHQLGAVLKRLTELFHFTFHTTDTVNSFHIRSANINDGDTFLEQGRDLGVDLQQVLAQVHPEGVHLPEERLGPAQEVQRLQTLLVARQPALRALVPVEVGVLVTLATVLRRLNFLKFVRICSFGQVSLALRLF